MSRRVSLQRAVRAAVLLGALQPAQYAAALGLGDMEMRSFLNEPLSAEVELLDLRGVDPDDIRIRLAGAEDFDRLGIERSYFLTAIQFEVELDEASGSGVIRLSTEEPVLEPYLDVIIEARWPSGRLLREYTVLVDPPAFRQEVVTVSASEQVRRSEEPPPPPPRAEAPPKDDAADGDTLSVRGSDLAAGEMPSRNFSAQTSAQPSAGSRYMVKRDETLWQIASRGRPGGVSVQQAMLDIQRLNPEAFIGGNINQIKAGYIIYLPAAGEISSDDLADALEEVRAQNLAFESRAREPGVTAAATLRVSAEPAMDSAAEAGDVGISDAGVEGGIDAAGTAEIAEIEVESAAPATVPIDAELAQRLEAMANRLDTLEQIVALKDQQIATLELALREAREAATAAAESAAAAAPVAAPTPAAQPQPAVTPAPAPERGFLGSMSLLPILGGLAAILAAVGFMVLRRRRAADDEAASGSTADTEDDVFAGVSLSRDALDPIDEAVAEETGVEPSQEPPGARAAAAATSTGSRGYGERKHDDYSDEGASGDALAEADIYIAYGRYLQAIELLNTAIEDEPENSAYRLKLIELYVDMGEDGEAEEQLRRLREGGDAEAIARAETLVGGGPRTAEAEPAPADVPSTEDSEPVASEALEVEDAPQSGEEMAVDETLELDEEDYDADLELEDLGDVDEEDESHAEAELPIDSVGDDDILDFSDEAAAASLAVASASDARSDEQSADVDQGAGSGVRAEAIHNDDSLDPLEFEHLQIEEDVQAAEEADRGGDEELDLSEALREAAEDDDAAADGEIEELVIADDADQMATKLDLARAYLEMGDSDGARGILEQVMGAGSDEQQQEARELLSRID